MDGKLSWTMRPELFCRHPKSGGTQTEKDDCGEPQSFLEALCGGDNERGKPRRQHSEQDPGPVLGPVSQRSCERVTDGRDCNDPRRSVASHPVVRGGDKPDILVLVQAEVPRAGLREMPSRDRRGSYIAYVSAQLPRLPEGVEGQQCHDNEKPSTGTPSRPMRLLIA